MGLLTKRSRLSIDISLEERLWIKTWAASQNTNINDFVLSCIRQHMPCNAEHVPNIKTAASLRANAQEKDVITFNSPGEMFHYLGLPSPCLHKKSQKTSNLISKKRSVKKKT